MVSLVEKQEQATAPFNHKTLRFANLRDVDYLMTLAQKLWIGSPVERLHWNAGKVRRMLEDFIIDDKTEKLVLVSHDEGKAVGVLAAYAFAPLFSDRKIGIEVLWYLDEEYRKGRRGVDMMKAYEHWAKMVGCVAVQYGWMEGASPEGMKKLYEKSGAKLEELIYYKDL